MQPACNAHRKKNFPLCVARCCTSSSLPALLSTPSLSSQSSSSLSMTPSGTRRTKRRTQHGTRNGCTRSCKTPRERASGRITHTHRTHTYRTFPHAALCYATYVVLFCAMPWNMQTRAFECEQQIFSSTSAQCTQKCVYTHTEYFSLVGYTQNMHIRTRKHRSIIQTHDVVQYAHHNANPTDRQPEIPTTNFPFIRMCSIYAYFNER